MKVRKAAQSIVTCCEVPCSRQPSISIYAVGSKQLPVVDWTADPPFSIIAAEGPFRKFVLKAHSIGSSRNGLAHSVARASLACVSRTVPRILLMWSVCSKFGAGSFDFLNNCVRKPKTLIRRRPRDVRAQVCLPVRQEIRRQAAPRLGYPSRVSHRRLFLDTP